MAQDVAVSEEAVQVSRPPGLERAGEEIAVVTVDGSPATDDVADARTASDAWESLFRAQVAVMRRLQADDIWDVVSMREYDVLFTLSRAEGRRLRLRDLNRGILLSQPSLSRLVERLDVAGLVERIVTPGDARGTTVCLTEDGAALQRALGRRHVRAIQHYVAGALSETELRALQQLTDKLLRAQDTLADHTPGSV